MQVVENLAVGQRHVRAAAEEPEPAAEGRDACVLARQRRGAHGGLGEVGPGRPGRVVGVEAVDVHWRDVTRSSVTQVVRGRAPDV